MMGFEPAKHEVGVAPGAPSPSWNLRFLSEEEAIAALGAMAGSVAEAGAAHAPATATAPAPAVAAPPQGVRQQASAAAPGRGGQNAPGLAGRGGPAEAGRGFGGRGGPGQPGNQGGRGGSNGQDQASPAFQQLGVNQSADVSLFSQDGTITSEQTAELAPSANQAVVVQGSMSAALGLPGQGDFGPFGGRGGPDMMGMGGSKARFQCAAGAI